MTSSTRRQPRALDRFELLLIAVCLVCLPICAWYAFTASKPEHVIASGVAALCHALCIGLLFSQAVNVLVLPQSLDGERGFVSWCGGSCSYFTSRREYSIHYPPSWAGPLVRAWGWHHRLVRWVVGLLAYAALVLLIVFVWSLL